MKNGKNGNKTTAGALSFHDICSMKPGEVLALIKGGKGDEIEAIVKGALSQLPPGIVPPANEVGEDKIDPNQGTKK